MTVRERTSTTGKRITVRGVVQGVGFRPFVYRLAHELNLSGWVRNTSWGVEIEVNGSQESLSAFLSRLENQAPPLAHIETITQENSAPNGYQSFTILESSRQEGVYQLVSPDVATCPDCLNEILDPDNRRYRYPFTNCTNCGPRFTIISDIPYDRPNTTMHSFEMCSKCQSEYDDPLDRRFHAQPNACPVCGPHLQILDSSGKEMPVETGDAIMEAASILRRGNILALKGLGGFHLACDATNDEAIETLRVRKGRPAKPLAVMIATLDQITSCCHVSPEEAQLLTSPQCPIVLLEHKLGSGISELVAPHNRYLGVMLPYTPLHHILLHDIGRPLVMTSGNLSEEPIAKDNDEALRRLGRLADYFLMHNRDVYARYDDSVWFVTKLDPPESKPGAKNHASTVAQPVRRSRGYAPFPIQLPFDARPTLACGASLKNTFCITKEKHAFLSQHIGDMENPETLEHFETSIELYKHLFKAEPEILAHDLHPEYLPTHYALSQAQYSPAKAVGVQHHHAHIASCLVDNGWAPEAGPVIGIAFDGTGYGTDGHIWGGEFLVADYGGFQRFAHLQYLPMPGGDHAIRNPYRLAIAYLHTLLGEIPDLPFLQEVSEQELSIIPQQIARKLNTPMTSAVGRLFDAVSALLNLCTRTSYEAQAAIELEMIANTDFMGQPYPFDIEKQGDCWEIDLARTIAALVDVVRQSTPVGLVSTRFHATVASIVTQVCKMIRETENISTVALSGGCFQNRWLLRHCIHDLQELDFDVLVHHQVPCNDGGLSLGQAAIANVADQN